MRRLSAAALLLCAACSSGGTTGSAPAAPSSQPALGSGTTGAPGSSATGAPPTTAARPTATATTRPSAAVSAYVARVNALCAQRVAAAGRLVGDGQADITVVTTLYLALTKIERASERQALALRPPPGALVVPPALRAFAEFRLVNEAALYRAGKTGQQSAYDAALAAAQARAQPPSVVLGRATTAPLGLSTSC